MRRFYMLITKGPFKPVKLNLKQNQIKTKQTKPCHFFLSNTFTAWASTPLVRKYFKILQFCHFLFLFLSCFIYFLSIYLFVCLFFNQKATRFTLCWGEGPESLEAALKIFATVCCPWSSPLCSVVQSCRSAAALATQTLNSPAHRKKIQSGLTLYKYSTTCL